MTIPPSRLRRATSLYTREAFAAQNFSIYIKRLSQGRLFAAQNFLVSVWRLRRERQSHAALFHEKSFFIFSLAFCGKCVIIDINKGELVQSRLRKGVFLDPEPDLDNATVGTYLLRDFCGHVLSGVPLFF